MGKITDSAVTTIRSTTVTAPKAPTSEQIRMAQLLDSKAEDNTILKEKVYKVMELTGCDENSALVTLHDCDNDVELAVDKLLENRENGNAENEWIVQEGKKARKHVASMEDSLAIHETYDNFVGKSSGRRNRGSANRGNFTVVSNGQARFRGRGGNAGNYPFGKENNVRFDAVNGERNEFRQRNEFAGERGRGERDGFERGRGRGFGGRGGRRGVGFNQHGGDGFNRTEGWNAGDAEDNTWDNSMANAPKGNKQTANGEWGKRGGDMKNNTWHNSAAQHTHDDDWGGEEEWSKVSGGLVIEQSGTHKVSDKVPVISADAVAPAVHAPTYSEASRVRGESINVNSLFMTSQPSIPPQPTLSSNAWTSTKAAVDLKNELGTGKTVPSPLADGNNRCINPLGAGPVKSTGAKVELPSGWATAANGPIDVQFGDMTLVSDPPKPAVDFNTVSNFQEQKSIVQSQQKDRFNQTYDPNSGDRGKQPIYSTPPKIKDTAPKVDTDPSSYIPNVYGNLTVQQPAQQVSQQIQQPVGQAKPPQSVLNQQTQAQVQMPANSAVSEISGDYSRSQLNLNNANVTQAQQGAINDSTVSQQLSKDDSFGQINMSVYQAASALHAASKNQASSAVPGQNIGAYQPSMLAPFLSMPYDQTGLNSLNYLPSQNFLVNGYDMRTVNPLAGTNMTVGRDTNDAKLHQLVRQENVMSTGNTPAAINSLNVPPPGLPAPTASNAEQAAAQLVNLGLYHQLQYLNATSPYIQPQFFVPNVSSSSALANNSQYQRAGAYQPPTAFNAGYDDIQQIGSQQDSGKPNYGIVQSSATQNRAGNASGGNMPSGLAPGGNDGNRYGGGMKVPFDSKQYTTVTGSLTPSLGNMNFASAPQFGYPGYFPSLNMMMTPNVQTGTQFSHDILNQQRTVNQTGKPMVGSVGVNKTMGQQFYGQSWGN